MVHDAGDPFTDPGAGVTVNVDASLTITGVSNVDPNVPGPYTIMYDYTDAAGNAAVTVIRAVNVVDTTVPVVTAPGDIVVEAVSGTGTPATDPGIAAFLAGATATNAFDRDMTSSITTDAPATFALGTTTVIFSVTDTAANTGTASARADWLKSPSS